MMLFWRAGMLAFITVFGMSVAALAQPPGPGTMKQDHQMGGMQQQGMPGMGMGTMKQDKQMGGMQQGMGGGMGMMDMCQKMQEGAAQDCKMMEGMGGRRQHISEMRKHLREIKKHVNMMDEMMDEMMEKMIMQRQQGMTPSGSGAESQEHHPAESK